MDCNQDNLKPVTDAMLDLLYAEPRLEPLERAIYFLIATGAFSDVTALIYALCRDENSRDISDVLAAIVTLDKEGLANIPVTVRTE